MSGLRYVENMINSALLQIHTAYIGKVISVNSNITKATVQPLNLIKTKDGTKTQAVQKNIPVINSARYKVTEVVPERFEKLKSGDLVLCVCADRDITQALKGKNSVPVKGHHDISASIVVGIL